MYNVKTFPIDCFYIASKMGYKVKKYNELSEKKRNACIQLSEDACLIKKTIYYNDDMPSGRIRFSIMHEIGHIVLDTENETDANYFASHILAPRMAIHYAHCKNEVDVSKIFLLTAEAARYAFDDYRRWHRMAVYKMSETDREMYNHFYNTDAKMFVYSVHDCSFCNNIIYNSIDHECPTCKLKFRYRYRNTYINDDDYNFVLAENNWLYGDI